jgi:hypothetical protein
MADDPLVATTLLRLRAEPPAPEAVLPAPTAEQMRSADCVFEHSKDSDLIAGLMGMHMGIILLKDLATEHFQSDEEEDDPRFKPLGEPDPV